MTDKKPPSTAQFMDRFLTRCAYGVALISISFGVSAAMSFVSEDTANILDWVTKATGLLAVLLVIGPFLRTMRFKIKNPRASVEPDGFISQAYRAAAEKAFAFTFIFLLGLQIAMDKGVALPAEATVEIIIAVTLGIFAITFFWVARDTSDEDDDFDEGAGA